MPSTTIFRPGDVIAVRFRFHEGQRPKPRPAVVVSVPRFNAERIDAVFVAVTSGPREEQFGDCRILDWQAANLRDESVAKGIFRTIDQRKAKKFGELTPEDHERLMLNVKEIFGL